MWLDLPGYGQQPLPALEMEWLLGRPLDKAGIVDAMLATDARKLLFEYDPDLVDRADLIEFMHMRGIQMVANHHYGRARELLTGSGVHLRA